MSRRWLPITVCLLFVALVGSGKARDAKPSAPDSKEIERLIKDLSSDEFDVRETASRKLTELGEAVAVAVENAAKSADAETSRRAGEILQKLNNGREERELKEFIERLVKELSDDEFDARETASRKLTELGEAAAIAVEKGRQID